MQQSQPEVFTSSRTIPRQIFPSAEDYAIAQAQKALNVARATRGAILKEERRSLERLGEGTMHIKVLESRVVDARKRLASADHHIAALHQDLLFKGVVVDENGAWAYATSDRFRTSPFTRSRSPPTFEDEISTSSAFQGSCNTRCEILQEPIVKPDIFQWSQATCPGDGLGVPSPTRELSPIEGICENGIKW